jgi:hypothetical protein
MAAATEVARPPTSRRSPTLTPPQRVRWSSRQTRGRQGTGITSASQRSLVDDDSTVCSNRCRSRARSRCVGGCSRTLAGTGMPPLTAITAPFSPHPTAITAMPIRSQPRRPRTLTTKKALTRTPVASSSACSSTCGTPGSCGKSERATAAQGSQSARSRNPSRLRSRPPRRYPAGIPMAAATTRRSTAAKAAASGGAWRRPDRRAPRASPGR